jgi:hypothetical protein
MRLRKRVEDSGCGRCFSAIADAAASGATGALRNGCRHAAVCSGEPLPDETLDVSQPRVAPEGERRGALSPGAQPAGSARPPNLQLSASSKAGAFAWMQSTSISPKTFSSIENLLASPGSVFVLPVMGSPIGYEQVARRRSVLLFFFDSYCAAYMLCPTPPCPFSMRMETSLRQVLFRELSKWPELCPPPDRARQAGFGGCKREFCEAL